MKKEELEARFKNICSKLKSTGFKGEIFLNKDGLFMTTNDSYSKQVLQVSAKRSPDLVLYSPRGSAFCFAVYPTGLIDAKKALKALSKAA